MTPDLDPELCEYRRQFESIEHEARLLLAGLTDEDLTWREMDGRWSIAECFDHLVVTGSDSLPRMREAMRQARDRGLVRQGPFQYGMIQRWFVRLMDAPPKMKFKVPRAYRSLKILPVSEVIDRFFLLQSELMKVCDEANGIHLAAVKVSNPVTWWFRLSLGQELAFAAAHTRRHLWQASKVREKRRRLT